MDSTNILKVVKNTNWKDVADTIQTRNVTQTWIHALQYLRIKLKRNSSKGSSSSQSTAIHKNMRVLDSSEAEGSVTDIPPASSEQDIHLIIKSGDKVLIAIDHSKGTIDYFLQKQRTSHSIQLTK